MMQKRTGKRENWCSPGLWQRSSAATYEWQKYDSFSTLQHLVEGTFSPINVDRFNICLFNIEKLQQRSYRRRGNDINGSLRESVFP